MYSRAPKQQTAHNSPSSHQQSNSHLPFIHAFEHNNMLEWIRMYILYYVHMWTVESSAQVPLFFFSFFIVVDGVLLVATRRSTGILSYPHIHIASWAYEERIRVERGASRRSSSLSFIPIFSVGFELGISLFVFFFFASIGWDRW